MKSVKMWMLSAMILFAAASCQQEERVASEASSKAGMTIKMTDSPGDYIALEVEVTEVEVYSENEGWITLNSTSQSFNVLDLTNGSELRLASHSQLEAGVYSRARLTFAEEAMLRLNAEAGLPILEASAGNELRLKWKGPREVEVEIDQQLSAGSQAEVLLDFNVAKSIEEHAQEYVIDPAIECITNASTGIRGEVEGAANVAIIVTDGEDTLSTYANASGEFLLRGVDEGTYTLTAIPEACDNILEEAGPVTIDNMVVANGEFRQVGTIRF